MADTAANAWAHCLAVLRQARPAEEVAVVAVRRGGRPRTAVLAQARALALARAEQDPPPSPPMDQALAEDLDVVAVALLLAGTRPPVERSIVDLDGRLDRGRLARALGLSLTEATTRANDVANVRERELDPALLAWLGPGECVELAAVLTDAGLPDAASTEGPDEAPAEQDEEALPNPVTLDVLLRAAPAVAAHVETCEVCSDRRRSVVSVRALQAQAPLPPVPRVVRAARTTGLLRVPAPWPPPLGSEPSTEPAWRRWALLATATFLLAGAAGGGVALWRHDRGSPTSPAVALAALPGSGNALAISPTLVPSEGLVVLTNVSGHRLSWLATPSADWVSVSPVTGTLDPGQHVNLMVASQPTAPPGGARGTVGITGSDGSAAQVDVTAPAISVLQVAATLKGCTVRAHVVDAVDATPTLHYRDTAATAGDQALTMAIDTGGYTAALPTTGQSITWWVTATDTRGGAARTPDQVTTLPTCTPGS